MTAKSLVSVLKKVKLPKVAFHLAIDRRITKLVDLEQTDKAEGVCECMAIKATEVVVGENGTLAYNEYTVALNHCYATIDEVIEARRIQDMQNTKKEFIRKSIPGNRSSITEIVKFLRNHPALTLVWYTEHTDLDNPPKTVEEMKRDHFRESVGALDYVKKLVIDAMFPELAQETNSDEEDW